MAIYEISTRTTLLTATALAQLASFRSNTAQRAGIREIHLSNVTAPTTSGSIGLMRSTALSVTPTGVTTPQQREPGAAPSTAALYTGWATAPTVGAVGTVFRRWSHGTAIGNAMIWTFDLTAPMMVPLGNVATGELVFVNLNATAPATYDITVVWDE